MPEEHTAGGNWSVKPEQTPGQIVGPQQPAQDNSEITWSASEFVAHQKTFFWYLMLIFAAGVITTAVYLITNDKISSITIALAALALGVFGARQPRVLNYRVNSTGITIGKKFYDWDLFKSFAIIQEGALDTIFLTPLKRFMPPITIYYAPEDEERILDVISISLPMEERSHDFVDRLLRKIRF